VLGAADVREQSPCRPPQPRRINWRPDPPDDTDGCRRPAQPRHRSRRSLTTVAPFADRASPSRFEPRIAKKPAISARAFCLEWLIRAARGTGLAGVRAAFFQVALSHEAKPGRCLRPCVSRPTEGRVDSSSVWWGCPGSCLNKDEARLISQARRASTRSGHRSPPECGGARHVRDTWKRDVPELPPGFFQPQSLKTLDRAQYHCAFAPRATGRRSTIWSR